MAREENNSDETEQTEDAPIEPVESEWSADAENTEAHEAEHAESEESEVLDEPAEESEAQREEQGTDASMPEPQTPQKSGFIPMVLGGILAAAIGAGGTLYLLPNLPEGWLPGSNQTAELQTALASQAEEMAALKAALAEVQSQTALEDMIAEAQAAIDTLEAQFAQLKDQEPDVSKLEARLAALEKAPMATAAPEAVEAYKREMAALNAALAEQRAAVEAMAADAEAKKASAEMTAEDALRRSALSQILTSLETGSPYADALSALSDTGIEPPEALLAQADGVTTVAALSEGFAPVARAALAAARRADGGGGLGSFLKTQLGARSLEPREGSDPDAVLSRMEAAAREGRFGDVEAEADALPEAAKTELQDWLAAVRARKAAVEAAELLSQQINSN